MMFLYIVGLEGRTDVCKIGISSNVAQRLGDLQTANPDVLYCYRAWQFTERADALKAERNIHALLFRKYRSRRGEWFFVSPGRAERIARQWIKGSIA
jgi:hypothetical protein